jgi:hypothetical protein
MLHKNPPTPNDPQFRDRLERLRLKIDALPEALRPHLVALAETIDCQHRRLQSRIAHSHADE